MPGLQSRHRYAAPTGDKPRVFAQVRAMNEATSRIPALDVARGIAIAAMVVYHFAWDLSHLGLVEADVATEPGWVWFAHGIAASFLLLVGVGLHLAHGGGLRQRAFLRRLGMVAGAAGLVTLITFLVFPDRYIFFGILHAIALGSVLALPFLRLPAPLLVLAALLVLLLPLFIRFEAFSSPWLIWTGLGTRIPTTQDFVPLFPWFGWILLGVALAKRLDLRRFAGPEPANLLARSLAWSGRRSLPIYLIHQPVLFGALSVVAAALAPVQDLEARGFLTTCQSQCRAAGREAATCVLACQCAIEGLKAENLWASVLKDRLEAEQRPRFEAVLRRCAEVPIDRSP